MNARPGPTDSARMSLNPEPERRPTASLLRRFEVEFLRPYRWAIALGLIGLLVQSVLLLPVPLLQGWVVDRLVAYCRASGPGSTDLGAADPSAIVLVRSAAARAIVLALVGTIALHGVRTLLAWRLAAMMGRISQEVVVSLRGALHRKLMRLPMAYFDAQQTGRLMARVTSDVGSILMFIRSGILQLLNDLITSLAIAILLTWLQWRLALVALVAVPLYALNQGAFFGKLRRLSDEIRGRSPRSMPC